MDEIIDCDKVSAIIENDLNVTPKYGEFHYGMSTYDVQLLTRFNLNFEVSDKINIHALNNADSRYIAIENVCFINDSKNDHCDQAVELDFRVNCIAVCEEGDFLVVGSDNGKLSIIYVPQHKCLFTHKLFDDDTGDKNIGFCGAIFTSKDSRTGLCEIVIVSNFGHVFILNNIHLGELRQKLSDPGNESFKPILEIDEFEIPMTCNHLSYSRILNQHVVLLSGDGIKILSNKTGQEFDIIHSKDKNSFFDQEIVKSEFCCNQRYALLLDTSKVLYLLCLKTFIIIDFWNEYPVEDFTLFENCHSSRNLDPSILMKVKMQNQYNLQLYSLPTFQIIYSVQVHPSTYLFQLTSNSENVLLLDVSNEDLKITNCNGYVHSIVEASANSRFLRLIAKKNFEEAINFAKEFNLDTEIVYIRKAADLLEQVRMHNQGESAKETLSLLYSCFDHLTDLNLLINMSMEAVLPTLEDTKDLFQYAISKTKSDFKFESEILKWLFTSWKKLETFKLIKKMTDERLAWDRFKTADLWEEMIFCLRNDNIATVSLIWARHSQELLPQLNSDHIAKFLDSIPETRISASMLEWLKRVFLPLVLFKINNPIEIVASWIIYRCNRMEFNDASRWPNNAVQFANMFVDVCKELAADQNLENLDYAIDLAILMNLDSNDSAVSLLRQFRYLMDNLRDLELLRTKYNCKIPLSNYSHESKTTVVYYLFAYLDDSVEISDFVDNFLKSFASHYSLTVDVILKNYIQEFLERTEFAWRFWEEAPWEKHVVAVINCIKSDTILLETLCQVLKGSPVPWTSGIRQLAENSLKVNHSLVSSIKNEIAYEAQQVIMRKYSWFHTDALDYHNGHILIRNILSSSSADKNAIEDALTIATAVNISKVDVYFFLMIHLIKTDQMEEYSQFLKSLTLDVAITCCKRLAMFAHGLCFDHCDIEELVIERLNIISVAIHAIQFLQQHISAFDFHEYSSYMDTFLKLRAILEFGVAIPICLLHSKENSLSIVGSCIDSFLLNQSFKFCGCPMVPASFQHARKVGKNNRNLSDIFWLGNVLNVPVSHTSEILIMKAVEKKNFKLALETCIYLCCEESPVSKISVHQLKKLIFHIIINLGSESKLSSLWKCFDQLNFMLSRAAISSYPVEIITYVSIQRWVYLLKHVIQLNDINSDFSQGLSQDAYNRWTLSTVMQDTSVYLDSQKIVSLISMNIQNLVKVESGSSEFEDYQVLFALFKDLIDYLSSRGRILLSYYVTGIQMEIFVSSAIHNDWSDSFLNKISKRSSSLIISVLKNLFGQKKLDTTLALGLIMSLAQEKAVSFLNFIEKKCGLDYGKLSIIAALGIEVCQRWGMKETGSYYSDLIIEANWGKRLSRFHISYKDVGSLGFTKLDLISQMANHNKITFNLIKEYAATFGIENDQMYCTVLKVLLTNREKDSNHSRQLKEIVQLCALISQQILDRDLLLSNLRTICEKVDPYNYEIIEFLLNLVLQINSEINVEEDVDLSLKSLKLLSFLYSYERLSKPSEFEINLWLEDNSEGKYNQTECLTRLPFHYLLVPAYVNKIIVKELTLQTYMLWLEVSSILSISKNNIIMITINNIVGDSLSGSNETLNLISGRNQWEESEGNIQMFANIYNLLKCIGDLELTISCVISMVKKLSSGTKKILAVDIAINFSQKWFDSCGSEKSLNTLKILKAMRKNLLCEQLFHRLKLDIDYTSMKDTPEQMIISILEHPSVEDHYWFTTNRLSDLFGACKELAGFYNINFEKLCMSLLHKWLVPSEYTLGGILDESITVDLDVSQLDGNCSSNLNSGEVNLKRSIYLLRQFNTEDMSKYVVYMLQNSSASLTQSDKLKYLVCLFHTQNVDNLQFNVGHTMEELRIMAKQFYCGNQLECIGMAGLVQELVEKQAITNLIIHLIHTYGHKQTAVLLAVDLCFENQIYNVTVWENLLKRMMMLKLVKALTKSLSQISVCPEIITSKLYHKSWRFVLSNSVSDDEESICLSTLMLIQKCVIFRQLDVLDLAEGYKEANLHVLVLRCFLGLDNQNDCNLIKEYVSENRWEPIAKQVIELYTQVGDLYHMNEILMTLILCLTGNGLLTQCLQSSHGPWFKKYICDRKNLHRVLVFAAKNKMWKESGELIRFDEKYQTIVKTSGEQLSAKDAIKHYAELSQLDSLMDLTSGL